MMEYYKIFVDAWRMFKRYRNEAKNDERFFNAVFETASIISNAHQTNKDFTTAILLAVVEELRRIAEGNNQ